MSENLDYLVTYHVCGEKPAVVTRSIETLEDLLSYVHDAGDSVTVRVVPVTVIKPR